MKKKKSESKFVEFLELLKKLGDAVKALRVLAQMLIAIASLLPIVFTWFKDFQN